MKEWLSLVSLACGLASTASSSYSMKLPVGWAGMLLSQVSPALLTMASVFQPPPSTRQLRST